MAFTVSPDDALLALGPAESPITMAAVYTQLAMAQMLTNPDCLSPVWTTPNAKANPFFRKTLSHLLKLATPYMEQVFAGPLVAPATLGEVKALAEALAPPPQTPEPETAADVSTPEATGHPIKKAPSPAVKPQPPSTDETVPPFLWDNTPPHIAALCREAREQADREWANRKAQQNRGAA